MGNFSSHSTMFSVFSFQFYILLSLLSLYSHCCKQALLFGAFADAEIPIHMQTYTRTCTHIYINIHVCMYTQPCLLWWLSLLFRFTVAAGLLLSNVITILWQSWIPCFMTRCTAEWLNESTKALAKMHLQPHELGSLSGLKSQSFTCP